MRAAIGLAVLLAACQPANPPHGEATAPTAASQARPCHDREPRLIHYARWLATDPDPQLDALRRRYEIEMTAASDVEQITDPALCLRAGTAYRDALDLRATPPAVAVIRIGDRYVVTSRADGSASGQFASAVVLDRSLRVVATARR